MAIKHLLAGMILQGNGVFPSQGAFYWDDCTTPSWKLAAKALKNKQKEAGSSFLPFQGRAVHFREGTNIGTDEFPGLKIQKGRNGTAIWNAYHGPPKTDIFRGLW